MTEISSFLARRATKAKQQAKAATNQTQPPKARLNDVQPTVQPNADVNLSARERVTAPLAAPQRPQGPKEKGSDRKLTATGARSLVERMRQRATDPELFDAVSEDLVATMQAVLKGSAIAGAGGVRDREMLFSILGLGKNAAGAGEGGEGLDVAARLTAAASARQKMLVGHTGGTVEGIEMPEPAENRSETGLAH